MDPSDSESKRAVAVFGRVLVIAIGLTMVGFGVNYLRIGLQPAPSESFSQLDVVTGGFLIALGSLVVLGALISLVWRLSRHYGSDR